MRPTQETKIDPPSVLCTKCGKKPSARNTIVVTTLSGIEQRGAFWQYGRYDRGRRKVRLLLKPQYRFVRWEERCESC